MGIYEERLERIKAAIALEPVDKVPVISGAIAFSAKAAGVNLGDYLKDMELCCTTNLKAAELMGNIDGIQAAIYSADLLPAIWLSETKVPGRELSNNELWQVKEYELIKQDDYDVILEDGFAPWYIQFMKEKLGDPMAKLQPYFQYAPVAAKRAAEAGYPLINGNVLASPFEMLCGGRSLETFLVDDILEIPEKIDQVFAKVHEFNMHRYEESFQSPGKPFGVWIGGWRGTPQTLSLAMFEHFCWPYLRDMIQLAVDYDVVPILHLDSSWDNGLSYFRDVPAKKCIMALDGKTNIFKAKEILGDRMCLMGDVPAEMLAFGKAQDVYDYTMERIQKVGPVGYMVCSGCDIPFNGILDNVRMMAKAADDAAR